MKELMRLLHVNLNISMPYHLQMDGQTERVNREIWKYLWIFIEKQDEWTDWISATKFAYNNLLHSATRYTPFWLNKGCHPAGNPDELELNDVIPATDLFMHNIK